MKKCLLFFVIIFLLDIQFGFSQTLSDYISEVKGDTLVVKDYYEMNNQENSLYYALFLDTINVPEGRVYELKANGYYPLLDNPVTSSHHPTVIAGTDPTILVNNKKKSSPPLICCQVALVESLPVFAIKGDLTVKNCELIPANAAGTKGWSFFNTQNPGINLLFENCLFEHTQWVFVSIENANCSLTFRDCYFVNMSGCPSNTSYIGGVFNSTENTDSLVIENSTFIMAEGNIFNFGSKAFNRAVVNHNTFINCAGGILSNSDFYNNLGLISNVSLTNNIFINCNILPIDSCKTHGSGKKDLLSGIVNINKFYVDSTNSTKVKYLAQNNLAYWDPAIISCDSILNAQAVNGSNCWQPQTTVMTPETQNMFDDNNGYRYLVTDVWKNIMPHFANSDNLFTAQSENIKDFVLEFADSSKQSYFPLWRLLNTGNENFVYPDFPIPVDLSYSDDDLLTVGLGGFPLGDLNWFPNKKTEWTARRAVEYDKINNALNAGELVSVVYNKNITPLEFQLNQNYPNPFNPGTIISYRLSTAGAVTLKIYDILGQEVAILLNETQNSGTHYVYFDGSALTSGVYFCRLKVNKNEVTRKMVLLK